jgi:Flp pilus assembly protein TadG
MAAMNVRRSTRSRARSERGAEIIELVLVTPLLLLLLGAMFDFGLMFRNWEVVTNAAREGARMGALPSYACDNSTTDIKDRVNDYMKAAGVSTAYVVKMKNDTIATASGTFNGCIVHIELTQQLPTLSVFGKFFGGSFGTVPLRATSFMRTETQVARP